MPQEILYDVRSRVAWLTINRPEVHNALNAEARRQLAEAAGSFAADSGADVLVITGSGERAFCAGADLREMSATQMAVPPRDFLVYFNRTLVTDKPVIAAVNGVALAGGFLLAQMSDLVIAADHAKFGVTEAKVGRGSPWAAPLPWIVGPRAAMEMLMVGDPISASRGYEIGLVNRVVPASELLSQTEELASRISRNAPLSVRAAKRMVMSTAVGWHDALAHAERIYEGVYLSEDAQEGPRAFLEKRDPIWAGR